VAINIRRGYTVAVVDLDPQPSACAWADLRGKREEPVVIDAKPTRLAAAVEAARAQGGLDLLIIDTGGRTEEGPSPPPRPRISSSCRCNPPLSI
jgi:chromosome partitioning protein